MRRLAPILLCLSVAALAAACQRSASAVAARPICVGGFIASWSADSALAPCLPPGFHLAAAGGAAHARWERGDLNSADRAWLSISIESTDVESERWSPYLASPPNCVADCASTDSVIQHSDSVATGVAAVEVGLVSGGYPGFSRQPMMVAGWKIPPARRVWVNALAAKAPVLDTLRRALRSVQFSER